MVEKIMIMNFNHFREFFIFSHQERNGLIVLVILIMATVCIDFLLPYLKPEQQVDVTAWKKQVEDYYAQIPEKELPVEEKFIGTIDANRAELSELLKIGLPVGLAGNWVKYLLKGGRFRTKEEVRKLYGMTDDLFRKVEGNLIIHPMSIDQGQKSKLVSGRIKTHFISVSKDSIWKSRTIAKREILIVNVNQADSAQLEALPGIGPVLASRIIKYRKLLGGFYHVAQVREVYGMSDELWIRSSPCLRTDSSGMKQLELNFLSVAELGRHPYIGYRQAKKIVKKRDAQGKIKSLEELVPLFTVDSLKRLLPYLSFP